MIIREKRFMGRNCYFVSSDSDKRIVECRLVKLERDGKVYFLLYDDCCNCNMEFFTYLNDYLFYAAYNTREMYANAIRLLYCFLAITHTDISKMTLEDINHLKLFLLGYSVTKGNTIYDIATKRKKAVVNSYLGVYREYFSYCGYECKAIFEAKQVIAYGSNLDSVEITHYLKYRVNEKTGNPVVRVPRYISVEEYSDILKYLQAKKNIMAIIIIRLMYEAGLRISEVLSLTSEDVCRKKMEGELKPVIYLRNRIHKACNGRKVSCKGLGKVQSKDNYSARQFSEEGVGYEVVPISESLYSALNDYIDDFLDEADKNGYIESFVADSLLVGKHTRQNYYIFSSKRHTCLSVKSWNEQLRKIFRGVGILLDYGQRKHNLNHRLRHGFAMFQLQHRHIDVLQLSKLMRHRSIASTMVYFRPTEKDEYNLKTDFTKTLYESIQVLKNKEVE